MKKELKIRKELQVIVKELKKFIKNNRELSEVEKAFFLYVRLGNLYAENLEWEEADLDGKIKIYNTPVEELDKINKKRILGKCIHASNDFVTLLKSIGINYVKLTPQTPMSPITHVDVIFMTSDGEKYLCNIIGDFMRINFGFIPRCFGIDVNRIPDYYRDYKKIIKKENVVPITEEKIKSMYDLMVNPLKGLYTNDVLIKLKEELGLLGLLIEYEEKVKNTNASRELTNEQYKDLKNFIDKKISSARIDEFTGRKYNWFYKEISEFLNKVTMEQINELRKEFILSRKIPLINGLNYEESFFKFKLDFLFSNLNGIFMSQDANPNSEIPGKLEFIRYYESLIRYVLPYEERRNIRAMNLETIEVYFPKSDKKMIYKYLEGNKSYINTSEKTRV